MLRNSLTAVLVFAAVMTAGEANAYSDKVRRLCRDDYLNFCSQYEVGSPELKACMHKAGPKLNSGCVGALVEAGEVPAKGNAKKRAGP